MLTLLSFSALSPTDIIAFFSLLFIVFCCLLTWVMKVERKLATLCNELSHIRDVLKDMKHFSDLVN